MSDALQNSADDGLVNYFSYNGLARRATLWGIPYMVVLGVVCVSVLAALVAMAVLHSPTGLLFALPGVPVLLFIKMLAVTDDRALDILLIELRWTWRKRMARNGAGHGGTLTLVPMTYGRRIKHARRILEATAGR